ncbi:MAG: hypothetical protein V2A58_10555 [Planctomycetota bacterium]
MISPLVRMAPKDLDPKELLGALPSTRVDETDQRYVNEVLDAGFGNWESADVLACFNNIVYGDTWCSMRNL